MPRTASPATPGTTPQADAEVGEALLNEGLRAEVAETEADKLRREMADLKALVQQLSRNQVAQVMPEQVELPDLADIMKKPPSIAVLTKQGWYVPEVHPTDRKA